MATVYRSSNFTWEICLSTQDNYLCREHSKTIIEFNAIPPSVFKGMPSRASARGVGCFASCTFSAGKA
ncbi:unnamed protein product [Prunus armeniaca]